jgi:uncharacterized membrane protein HdeD (DUF308 family)
MDQAQSWLVMGLVLGIILIWAGILLALFSMPLAKGQVRARDYNYRPLRPLFRKWFGMTDDVNDEAGRQGAKLTVAYSIFMVIPGVCSIFIGLASLGNPLI